MYIRALYSCVSMFLGVIGAFAQSTEGNSSVSYMEMAQKAYGAKNYDLALYAYNQVAFENYPQVDPTIQLEIGRCYLAIGDYEQAGAFFDRSFFSSKLTSQQQEAILLKSRALIGQYKYTLALSELYSLDTTLLSHSAKATFYLFKGLCLYEMEQFEAAEAAFLALVSDSNHIQSIFASPKQLYRPRSTLALALSAMVPGSGQLYAKEYREAGNSFLINSVFIFYYLRIFNLYGPLDAFIAVLPWFQRYYVGGYNKASLLAYQKMLANRKLILASILADIEKQNP
ncbi:MAG: tetratricopeptide repeat protein [Sphingobacteriaceae bacterium]|nr:tetratricopeptide repeat protein [Sphingobacteriaceae bacterium]